MLGAGRSKITEDLRFVIGSECSRGLQFYHYAIFDPKIGIIVANRCAVFVEDRDGMLLPDVEAGFAKTVHQGVFINFLKVSMGMIDVDFVGALPDLIAEFVNVFHDSRFSTEPPRGKRRKKRKHG